MFKSLIDGAISSVDKFIGDPVGVTVKITTQPIVDGCDLLDGLSQAEFREKAAMRLGADVVGGMLIGEIVEALADSY
jgi:hypothetical protein